MQNFDDLFSNNMPDEQVPQLSKEEYAEKKQAEREEVFSLADQTALEVAKDGGKYQSFLNTQANLSRYSAVNTLLVYAKNPNATRLGDFAYWKKEKCPIKDGQTHIKILEPQEYTKDDGTVGTGYNVKKVFDISQVDTRKLKNIPQKNYDNRQILSALISKYPLQIIGVNDLPDNKGAMTNEDGHILVKKGMEFSDSFRSIAYEMACAEVATDPMLSSEQEFSAYSSTYILCKKYGADVESFKFDDAPAMFEGMDAQEIKTELAQIRDTVEEISGRMEQNLEVKQKAAKQPEAR